MPPSSWWYPLGADSELYGEVERSGCGWVWYVEGCYVDGRWVPERDDGLECPVCLEKVDA